jgi:ComF family protein
MSPPLPSPLATAADCLGALLLPQPCQLCGGHGGRWPLCPPCAAELPAQPEACCPRCGEDSAGGETCGACLAAPPPFTRTVARWRYRAPVDRLIADLKFGAALHLAPWFAAGLAERIPAGCDALVAMPLHRRRLAERGFNQAREIAAPLARRLGLPLFDGVCLRQRDTAHQADLDAEARRANLRDAFACPPAAGRRIAGRHLLVVDDVMTTGATMREAAAVLLAAGAAAVTAAVVARTPQR